MKITFLNCFILISALWRVSNLVANEDGPFDMFQKLRRLAARLSVRYRILGAFGLYKGMRCEWCNSVWFAIPLVGAWVSLGDVVVTFALPFAFSAWVIVMKYFIHLLQNAETYYHKNSALWLGGVDFANTKDKSKVVSWPRAAGKKTVSEEWLKKYFENPPSDEFPY